ncbi:alpha/beta fold hydrolase [Virgibacillus byunsanensis]|uniref:Alpha/beta fold hydrolase n=1 Tax=Virgibacillus byunsanensis TaxID=570945 RepID=A0ABW3LJB0_9BACI
MTANRYFYDHVVGQIHYRDTGGDKEVLICLHEMPLSSEVFMPMLSHLGGNYRVMTPDFPGFGESFHPKSPLTIEQVALYFNEWLEDLGVTSFSIFGVHGGAGLAIEMALQRPGLVKSLILSGVPLFTRKERNKLHHGLPSLVIQRDGNHLMQWWTYFEEKFKVDATENMIQNALLQILRAGPCYEWGYRAAFDYDPEPALRRLSQPIYLLVAEGDVLKDKNNHVKMISEHVKDETIINVPGQLSQRVPEKTAEKIHQFLTTF